MDIDNKESRQPFGSRKVGGPSSGKLVYSSPGLQVYGAVAQLTMGNNGSNTDKTNVTKKGSDRRLKENIVRIGTHPLGIGLYLFDYKPEYRAVCGDGRQFGVMADEVETVMPSAVAMHPEGYKTVNYISLGISTRH